MSFLTVRVPNAKNHLNCVGTYSDCSMIWTIINLWIAWQAFEDDFDDSSSYYYDDGDRFSVENGEFTSKIKYYQIVGESLPNSDYEIEQYSG